MIKVLEKLLGKNGEAPRGKPKTMVPGLRLNAAPDFRAVEIAPSLMCCEAARKVSGKRFLLSKAPRMPLMGCTMPTSCACTFLKSKDRRNGDRRLLGAGASRWFAGTDGRKYVGRRFAER